jgi:hypothetical protein
MRACKKKTNANSKQASNDWNCHKILSCTHAKKRQLERKIILKN